MLSELLRQIRRYDMFAPGDTVICAVSGGADSMALLWGMYLLKEKLGIRLAAAHFNHGLRGEESQRDADFVRDFCQSYQIPLQEGQGQIVPGKKGLEAAARDSRYAFLDSLPGKIATAHTADDNAETVLMHLIRGTGLKGLGGIAPINGKRYRPMLTVTRRQVLAFLEEYSIPYVTDSTNLEDGFLRNRIRHHVVPLLKAENPRFCENVSQMAMGLRHDEQALEQMGCKELSVSWLKSQSQGVQTRAIGAFLQEIGVKEPQREHIALAQKLVDSPKPSAKASFPGEITVQRQYDRLLACKEQMPILPVELPVQGHVKLPEQNLQVWILPAQAIFQAKNVFTVVPVGTLYLRSRMAGDEITLSGGTKSLKKLFTDKKIPASQRLQLPVIADSQGVLGVYGIGVNQARRAQQLPALQIRIEPL